MIKDIIKYGEAEVTYKSKKILAEKPKLYNLFWETTLRCNAKCKHCGSRAGEDCNFKDELTTEEIKNALQNIANKYDANEILYSDYPLPTGYKYRTKYNYPPYHYNLFPEHRKNKCYYL